jgi:hypothetical protein
MTGYIYPAQTIHHRIKKRNMKRFVVTAVSVMMIGLFAVSCGPKPQYKTAQGKKKLKYYNDIQYDRNKVTDFKKWN